MADKAAKSQVKGGKGEFNHSHKSREVTAYRNFFIWYLDLAGLFMLTPFGYNRKRRKFQFTDSKLSYFVWVNAVQVLTVIELYSTYRLIKEFFVPDPNFVTFKILIYVNYYMMLTMCLVYELNLLIRGKQSIQLINTFVEYEYALADLLEAVGNTFDRKTRKEFNIFRRMIHMQVLGAFGGAIVIPFGFIMADNDIDPLNRFLRENFTPDFYDAWVIKGIFLVVFMTMAFHMVGTAMFGTFVIVLFVVRMRRHFKFLLLKDPNQLLRNHPEAVIKMYRCCEWITREINNWAYVVTPVLLFLGNGIHTILIFCAVKLHDVIPMPTYLVMPSMSIGLFFFEGAFFPMAAAVLDKSTSVSVMWMKTTKQKVHLKAFKSLRPFGFDVAEFFTINKDTTVTFGSIIIDNTVNLVLGGDL